MGLRWRPQPSRPLGLELRSRVNIDTAPSALSDVGSAEVRRYLVEALRLDLVGPDAGAELAEERLPGWVRPSNWYLTGFLVPSDAPPEQRCDADEDDPLTNPPQLGGSSDPQFDVLRVRYARRLRSRRHVYVDANGRTRGGVVVSDKLGRQSSGALFEEPLAGP